MLNLQLHRGVKFTVSARETRCPHCSQVPDHLNCLECVGEFQQLVEMSEQNADVKSKVCSLMQAGGHRSVACLIPHIPFITSARARKACLLCM